MKRPLLFGLLAGLALAGAGCSSSSHPQDQWNNTDVGANWVLSDGSPEAKTSLEDAGVVDDAADASNGGMDGRID